jgi:hypothetical protein
MNFVKFSRFRIFVLGEYYFCTLDGITYFYFEGIAGAQVDVLDNAPIY